jgi:hypothetical protein
MVSQPEELQGGMTLSAEKAERVVKRAPTHGAKALLVVTSTQEDDA